MMDWLNIHTRWLTENKLFDVVIGALIFLNPIALATQLWSMIKSPSVAGVSVLMWCIFGIIQIATALLGIKTKSASLFLSMVVSLIQTLAIITIVVARS